ncbi:nucleotidyltransferase family protein [Sutterella sp.]|uniref:nucleotidyltransferase family protein n=1 Tax=Sutterella sp. TaxID=1981025 RepID=UPI0026DF114D|nr:nucleotidyltransferase family protein [Sutterella sp.]MDO5531018.1 nucleotidyltransferase family protein [Sutterella sp.]
MRALILAAGEGRRLRPLTQIHPKPLTCVAGVPMIERQIAALKAAGIREFVVNAAHGARVLTGALGDGSHLGVRILWSHEGDSAGEALETRGGIVRALPLLAEGGEGGGFIVVAGDIVTDYDYRALVGRAAALSEEGALAHLILVPNPDFHPQGDLALTPDGLIAREGTKYTFSSLAAYHPALFRGVPDGRAKLFPWLLGAVDAGRVTGELFSGRWANVGTPVELERAEKLFGSDAA